MNKFLIKMEPHGKAVIPKVGMDTRSQNIFVGDKAGVFLSGLCAIHCLVMPFLIPFLLYSPWDFVLTSGFERWTTGGTLIFCFLSSVYSFLRKHHCAYPFVTLALSLGLIINKQVLGADLSPFVLFLSGVFLVLTHVINMKLCQSCPRCHH
jgi:hypothetical protein